VIGFGDKWEFFKLYRRREAVLAKLGSRKLWAAVIGAAMVTIGGQLGLPEDTTDKLVAIVVAYIVGQGVVDAVAAKNGGAK
jgi:hypothetical protein